ncbi:MAG TPA: vWA domain-containing protein [Thermoanaerobaculia bacterium]
MSKQIAILLDNSGSMFSPVGGSNPNTKIYETARGAEFFIQNLIDEQTATPGDFAISVHRFASSYQLLPGGAQIDSSQASFTTALTAMRTSIAAIENQGASQAAVGVMTDLYDGVRKVSDFLDNPANQPGFGAPDTKVIFLFTDGIQTISHGGLTLANYEADQGVVFSNLLNARGIKLVAWGTGSDALGVVLAELVDQAVAGGDNPVSESKVLFPIDESGTFENCTTIIAMNAIYVVSQNSVLPIHPVGEPPSGLLWEQLSLPGPRPRRDDDLRIVSFVAPSLVNYRDFEVEVDGSTRELVLVLVRHSLRGSPTMTATAPSGATFGAGTPGSRSFAVANAWALKIPGPEEGTWSVRVEGDPQGLPMVLDLGARGVLKRFGLEVKTNPRNLLQPGKVEVLAWPRWDGKPAEGRLKAAGQVLGGPSFALERRKDGSFAGEVEITRPGTSILVVRVEGTLEATGKSIRRTAFGVVLLGRARDPRLRLSPDTYEQGSEHTVGVQLIDERFLRSTQLRFGPGIQVLDFQMLSHHFGEARIRVAPDALLGEREVVSYHPQAESLSPVRVVAGGRGQGIPGRICCLRFDAAGRLIAVVLCDGKEVCVRAADERLVRLLELARERNLEVKIRVDANGCLVEIDICR